MRFKSTTGLAAIVTAAALALTGCGSGSGNGGGSTSSDGKVDGTGKTLNVLVGVLSQYPEQQKQWQSDIAAKFKAETGADVKFETFASANDELTRIQTSVVSGQGPDVYGLGTTFTPTAYATKAFVTLSDDDWKKVGGKDRFNPAALGISGPDKDHQAGIPFVSRPFVMAYNKDLLAAAGIDKPATSWDELAAQAKKMTNGDTYGIATGYKDNFDPWKFIWAMSVQAGNPLVDGNKLKMDDPTVKKAYQTYFGWLTNDKVVDPAAVGWSNSNAVAAFASGKAGYLMMTTSSSIPTLDKSAIAGKYEYTLMPTIAPGETKSKSDGDAASILSGDNLVVADYSKQKDLAFAYIKLITSKEEQLNYQKTFGDLPANGDALKELAGNAKLKPITDAAAKSKATPFTGAWGDIQLGLLNVTVQSVPDLAAGKVDEAALDSRIKDAQNKGQASLDRASKG